MGVRILRSRLSLRRADPRLLSGDWDGILRSRRDAVRHALLESVLGGDLGGRGVHVFGLRVVRDGKGRGEVAAVRSRSYGESVAQVREGPLHRCYSGFLFVSWYVVWKHDIFMVHMMYAWFWKCILFRI